MAPLQIPNRRERALVGAADLLLKPLRWLRGRTDRRAAPRRVLLLRLERIGDLLMVRDAIAKARRAWPGAEIDLAVGSWNAPLARMIPGLTRVHTADVPWLARGGAGDSWRALIRKARGWSGLEYDVCLNFEPDIRTNLLAWLTRAPERYGYWTGGGGDFLTDGGAYEPTRHVAENALDLVDRATAAASPVGSYSVPAHLQLDIPADASARAEARFATAPRPRIGLHTSGGRESKQWHLDRFAEVARKLATQLGATIVLTGSASDRPLVDQVVTRLSDIPVIDVSGQTDLVELAALLSRLDVLVTGDTGPMHLAAAVGTPVVALFGPSDPRRYGPLSSRQRVLRIDLPCAPCGLVRMPPERCRGHVPDCMDGITVQSVVSAAIELLDADARLGETTTR